MPGIPTHRRHHRHETHHAKRVSVRDPLANCHGPLHKAPGVHTREIERFVKLRYWKYRKLKVESSGCSSGRCSLTIADSRVAVVDAEAPLRRAAQAPLQPPAQREQPPQPYMQENVARNDCSLKVLLRNVRGSCLRLCLFLISAANPRRTTKWLDFQYGQRNLVS